MLIWGAVKMPDYGIQKNKEGYSDPTAYAGMSKILREEAEAQLRVNALIGSVKSLIDLAGFDLLNRIEVRDRKTGRDFK